MFLFKISGNKANGTADSRPTLIYKRFSFSKLIPIDNIEESADKDCPHTILAHVVELVDSYRSMVSEKLIIENQPLSKRFLYYGFHRSLFDLITYGKERENYKLVINLQNRSKPVVLRPMDVTPKNVAEYKYDLVVDLNPLPYTLYILMTDLGLCDFFRFSLIFLCFSLFSVFIPLKIPSTMWLT